MNKFLKFLFLSTFLLCVGLNSIHFHEEEAEAHLNQECITCLTASVSELDATTPSHDIELRPEFIVLEDSLSYSNSEYTQILRYSKGARAPPCLA